MSAHVGLTVSVGSEVYSDMRSIPQNAWSKTASMVVDSARPYSSPVRITETRSSSWAIVKGTRFVTLPAYVRFSDFINLKYCMLVVLVVGSIAGSCRPLCRAHCRTALVYWEIDAYDLNPSCTRYPAKKIRCISVSVGTSVAPWGEWRRRLYLCKNLKNLLSCEVSVLSVFVA